MIALSFEKAFSIELRSGLYGGSNLSVAPACSTASRIADDIMETFDHLRSEEVFPLFGEMGSAGRVIYLTHHRHLCDIAKAVIPDLMIHELG